MSLAAIAAAGPSPALLDQRRVRAFLEDGFMSVDCGLPRSRHERIRADLQSMVDARGNEGNNVLPLVPALGDVLASANVRGALTSLLGPDYLLSPHRYAHDSPPAPNRAALASRYRRGAGTPEAWVHQDSHSPLARPRHRHLWHAMLMYYPQDTPEPMGPTRLVPGSHLQPAPAPGDEERAVVAAAPAGTCVITHFDLVHGRSANLSEATRFMVKLCFHRLRGPALPPPCATPPEPIDLLCGRLVGAAERGWNEDAVVMEDAAYALADLGAAAVPALRGLARHAREWVRINAVFALGEVSSAARAGLPDLLALLEDPSHRVVRTALDAIGQIGGVADDELGAFARLLDEPPPSWREPLLRGWCAADQVRANLALALARLGAGSRSPVIEELLVRCLDDQGGYASGYAVEGLMRLGRASACEAAARYLLHRRWDASLRPGVRTY